MKRHRIYRYILEEDNSKEVFAKIHSLIVQSDLEDRCIVNVRPGELKNKINDSYGNDLISIVDESNNWFDIQKVSYNLGIFDQFDGYTCNLLKSFFVEIRSKHRTEDEKYISYINSSYYIQIKKDKEILYTMNLGTLNLIGDRYEITGNLDDDSKDLLNVYFHLKGWKYYFWYGNPGYCEVTNDREGKYYNRKCIITGLNTDYLEMFCYRYPDGVSLFKKPYDRIIAKHFPTNILQEISPIQEIVNDYMELENMVLDEIVPHRNELYQMPYSTQLDICKSLEEVILYNETEYVDEDIFLKCIS